MPTRVVAVVNSDEIETTKRMSFSWSCAPILYWMRCLGIPLDWPQSKSKKYLSSSPKTGWYWLTTLFGIVLFILNFAMTANSIHLTFIWVSSENSEEERKQLSLTMIWSSIIVLFNQSFITLGTQIALLASTLINWKKLVVAFHRIDDVKQLSNDTFKRIRRICEWGLFFIFMVILIRYFILSLTKLNWVLLLKKKGFTRLSRNNSNKGMVECKRLQHFLPLEDSF